MLVEIPITMGVSLKRWSFSWTLPSWYVLYIHAALLPPLPSQQSQPLLIIFPNILGKKQLAWGKASYKKREDVIQVTTVHFLAKKKPPFLNASCFFSLSLHTNFKKK